MSHDSPLWYPCTQMYHAAPRTIVRAQGLYVYDDQHHALADMISSWWVNLHGHCHPYINEAMRVQLDTLEHTMLAGLTHPQIERLAQRLVQLLPNHLQHCFFADSGSAAVEVALKMSVQYWRQRGEHTRQTFISLSGGYHGETLGSLSVTDIPLFTQQYEPLIVRHLRAPSPDMALKPEDCSEDAYIQQRLQEMQHLLEVHSAQVCAVIVEPLVQGAAGMKMYPLAYLMGLSTLCQQFNVHLIFDEIAVGFGRTGTLFVCQNTALRPDFVCLSKGLTAGYLPMAAVVTTPEVYQAFYDDDVAKGFLHSHSFTGNALAAAAANASLDIFEQQAVLAHNETRITYIAQQLLRFAAYAPYVQQVRQTGMIAALSLFQDNAPVPRDTMHQVTQAMIAAGFWIRPIGHHVYIIPPYCITLVELGAFFDALERCIQRYIMGAQSIHPCPDTATSWVLP